MGIHWTRMIPAGLVATVVVLATVDARATVVFSQSNLCGLESSPAAFVDANSCAEIVHETMTDLLSGSFQFDDPVAERTQCPEVARALTPLSDMSPPPRSIAGGGNGVGGFVISAVAVFPNAADLWASLAPEAKLMLPSGPPNRWFRPPRYERHLAFRGLEFVVDSD